MNKSKEQPSVWFVTQSFSILLKDLRSQVFFLYNVHHNLALRENIGNVVVVGDENNRNVEKQKRDVGK